MSLKWVAGVEFAMDVEASKSAEPQRQCCWDTILLSTTSLPCTFSQMSNLAIQLYV